jgi:putative hydrolase of HD superfamily
VSSNPDILTPTPRQEDKEAMERTAMQKMTSMLGKKTGDHLLVLWEEYEAGTSPEATLLKVCSLK